MHLLAAINGEVVKLGENVCGSREKSEKFKPRLFGQGIIAFFSSTANSFFSVDFIFHPLVYERFEICKKV